MDPKVNPCDDFYMHACGNTGGANPSMSDLKDKNLAKKLTDVFTTVAMPNDFKGKPSLENAFNQMQQLMKTSGAVDFASKGFQNMVNDLGGIASVGGGTANPYLTALNLDLLYRYSKLKKKQKQIMTVMVDEDAYKRGYNTLILQLDVPKSPEKAIKALVGYAKTHKLGTLTEAQLLAAYNALKKDVKKVSFNNSDRRKFNEVRKDVPELTAVLKKTFQNDDDAWNEFPLQSENLTQKKMDALPSVAIQRRRLSCAGNKPRSYSPLL